MSDTFQMTFHGTRGSRTMNGAECVEWGGHTTCVGILAGERQIILDAGSGVVPLGESMVKAHYCRPDRGSLVSYLFVTHTHYDHICGLPYYVPFYVPESTTYFYGPRNPYMSFRETIERFIHPPYHPVPMHEMQGVVRWGEVGEPDSIFFVRGQQEPVVVNLRHPELRHLAPPAEEVETAIHTMHGYNHPKCGVTIYKVQHAGRTVVFATDVEGYVMGDQRLIAFSRNADVLIHDAMYTRDRYASTNGPTQGWGHSTIEIATEVASKADVGKLVLVHHDPGHSDAKLTEMEAAAQAMFPRTVSGRDGMVIDLLASPPTRP